MKIHADGTLEGSPEELAAYKRRATATDLREEYIKLLMDKYERAVEVHLMNPADKYGIPLVDDASVDAPKELTEEQVSSLSTYRLVEELGNRTGVKHVRAHKGKGVAITIEGEMCADFITADETKDFQYILIERRNPAN